jgi:phospholipid/cholesterol/gamma-HCH transport system substrate-binding protein
MKRELVVGLIFAVILAALVGATIWVEKPGFFRSKKPFEMTTRFREVAGLREGDEVWVYGTTAGRVSSIRPDGKGSVEVALEMDYDPVMRENAEVKIASRSALGGAIVSIHPGTPDSPQSVKSVYDGRTAGDPFREIGDMVAELKTPLKDTIEGAKKVFTDLSNHSEQISANLDKTIENARQITDDLKAGKGTIGKLLTEEQLYDDLKAAVADLRKIAADASGGGGTIDVLLHDKEVAADLKKTVANIRSVSEDLEAGRGTMGKLFKDDTLYNRIDSAVQEFGRLATDAREKKGLLGKIIYDEEFANRFDTISSDIAEVTGKLRRGEGTLGKLINDESVYNELKQTLKKLGGGVDDVRENAPVLSFAGFLFSAF